MKKHVSHGEAEFKLAWGMKLGGKSFDDIKMISFQYYASKMNETRFVQSKLCDHDL